jgi:hypothetical protein
MHAWWCWWSLNTKYNHQLLYKFIWNESKTIVIGFGSNKFHEFWCSHLSCRNINFYQIKVSQMMNWSAQLWRAHRDDRNGYIICYIWSPELKDIKCMTKCMWEDSRRLQKANHRSGARGASMWGQVAPPPC